VSARTLPDPVSPELVGLLRRLKLGRCLDTLPERLTLARGQSLLILDDLCLVTGHRSPVTGHRSPVTGTMVHLA